MIFKLKYQVIAQGSILYYFQLIKSYCLQGLPKNTNKCRKISSCFADMRMMITVTLYICVAIFSLQIALKESHLFLRTILQHAQGQFMGEETELSDDKQLAKTTCTRKMEVDFEPLISLPRLLIPVFLMNSHNTNLKTIFPFKCTCNLYTSVEILYFQNTSDSVRGKRSI